jgi:hypothetical protein
MTARTWALVISPWRDGAQRGEHISLEHAAVLGECARRERLASLHPVAPGRGLEVAGGQVGESLAHEPRPLRLGVRPAFWSQ